MSKKPYRYKGVKRGPRSPEFIEKIRKVLKGPRPLEVRFWEKVDKNGAGGCWLWTGAKHPFGYGRIWNKGGFHQAHRISLQLAGVEIPEGMFVDHMCRVPACIRPEHLRIVTPRVNSQENNVSPMARNRLKTHCPRGHEYTLENTAVFVPKKTKTRWGNATTAPRPGRSCLTCYPWHWKHAVIPRARPPKGYTDAGRGKRPGNSFPQKGRTDA